MKTWKDRLTNGIISGVILAALATPIYLGYKSFYYKKIAKNIANQNSNISRVYDLENEIKDGLENRVKDPNKFLEANKEYVRLVSDTRTKKDLADCKRANDISEHFYAMIILFGGSFYLPLGAVAVCSLLTGLGGLKSKDQLKKNENLEENVEWQ